MSAALSHPWPGSRILAGWQPFLTRWQPHGLWLHHLALHRIEAPVAVVPADALDRLSRLLLQALTSTSSSTGELALRLSLERGFLERLLRELQEAGLIQLDSVSASWTQTAAARQALADSRPLATSAQRRTFWFAVGGEDFPGARFLPLTEPPTTARDSVSVFDPNSLRECLARSDDWKKAAGFPLEVRNILETSEADSWRRVIVDRPEQLSVLAVLTESDRLLAFPIKPPAWQLPGEKPILNLSEGWREALPELTAEPPLEAWRQAWRAWAQPRALPPAEVEDCQLEREGVRLRIVAPLALLDRLRAVRSDALKGDAWLLAGNSGAMATRSLALIELSARTPPVG